MIEPPYAIDEAGTTPLGREWRYAICLSDPDRPECTATIRQTRGISGTWCPWWCPACDAAYAARQERRRAAA
jgi:hypothetical protein